MRTEIKSDSSAYSVILHLWNGMPNDAREINGWFFSRDHAHATSAFGEHLGIGGTSSEPGRLIFQYDNQILVGKSSIKRWIWHQVIMVRDGDRVQVFLDDGKEAEIDATLENTPAKEISSVFIGGRSDSTNNWQGSIDEVAYFNRALDRTEREALSSATSTR